MKKNIVFLLMLFVFGWFESFSQTPEGFKYQTAIRDNSGNILSNKLVAIKLSLLTGSASGNVVYSEKHTTATNDFGVANLNVGSGTILQGTFSSIDWANGPYFLKVELETD